MKDSENYHKPPSMFGFDRISTDIERFSSSRQIDTQIEIADNLSSLPSMAGYYVAGAMFQELACQKELNLEEKVGFLAEAEKSWESNLVFKSLWNYPMNHYIQKSQIGLACLPLWASLAVDGQNPSLETTKNSYNKLVDIGLISVAAVKSLALNTKTEIIKACSDIRGGISEISALILLQRFVMQTLEDNSFTAVPSLLSQYHAKRKGSGGPNNGWDTSVFTKTSPEQQSVDLTYKLQIKTHHQQKEKKYSPDITVIAIGSDLVYYDYADKINLDSIIKNADIERQQTTYNNQDKQIESTLCLDKNTEILLNLMG